VVRDATTGRIDGVRYDELAPMLLNEVQQQHSQMTAQAEKIAAQDEHITMQAAEIRELKRQQLRTQQQVAELKNLKQQMAVMSTALQTLQVKHALVAQE
jgi:hypothetical protein